MERQCFVGIIVIREAFFLSDAGDGQMIAYMLLYWFSNSLP